MNATLTMRPTVRRATISLILTIAAVALSQVSIPVGIARISPTQHCINVLAAVLVGPWWGLGVALATSAARLGLGLGTPLAFPGSVFGVLLASWLFQRSRTLLLAALGELVGTGLIGALAGAALVAPYVMGQPVALTVLIVPFALSSAVGAALALLMLHLAGVGGEEAGR
ncbi:energy coupling factor transporter S component ThiW [Chloroflexia bacterium SDU3-3]|nr:energy coupling factor transporter S component ThiW [Chloroflexia bacterium SDU3-3]